MPGTIRPGGTVVLVTANGFWDALTASGIAGLADAPVVMTDGESLSEQAESVLSTLRPKTIIVSGGAAAVADSVADEASAAAKGATVKRCWGQVASDTAVDSFAKAASITGQAWVKARLFAQTTLTTMLFRHLPSAMRCTCPSF